MNSDTTEKLLKVVLFAQLLVEAIDDIKNTSLYKFKTKSVLNNAEKHLKDVLIQGDDVYRSDPEMITNFYNELDGLVDKLAQNNVVQLIMIKQIHDKYSEDPEKWDELFKLQLTKLKN